MSVLSVDNLSHSFGEKKILENASFKLLKGEHVGLVGANGVGKTTFLNIIIGKLYGESGKVNLLKKMNMGYLDQHTILNNGKKIIEVLREAFSELYELESDLQKIYIEMENSNGQDIDILMDKAGEIQETLEIKGFYSIDAEIEEFANGLGLGDVGLERKVDELSGGQRSKVLLTKLLLQKPTILILDEPTNYLDVQHIDWLKNFLKQYENSFILVSHDTSFVNEVVNVIYHLENYKLNRYKGNYEEFVKMHKLRKEQYALTYINQQKKIKKLEEFYLKNRAGAATSKRAMSRKKQLDKMQVISEPQKKIKPIFRFQKGRKASRVILKASNLVLGYDKPLTYPVNISIERGQKIAIKGINGLGKTTLIKTLLGIINPIRGEIENGDFVEMGYFKQEDNEENINTPYEEIANEYSSLTKAEVRTTLAKCGLKTEHIMKRMNLLSGGEQAKVRLCKLLLKKVNCLFLDEPANHLDVDAKAALKKALMKFQGTILLVCHEEEFYKEWVTDVWNVEEWTTKEIENYSECNEVNTKIMKKGTEYAKRIKEVKKENTLKFSYKEKMEYKVIDQIIEVLQKKLDDLNESMKKEACNYEALNRLVLEKAITEKELNEAVDRCEYLNKKAEEIEERINNKG